MARTLDDIKARCRLVDGHWLWAGALSEGKPRIFAPDFTRHAGREVAQPGRRAVWHIVNRDEVPQGWRVFGNCTEGTCLNPEHIVCEPMEERGRKIRESGVWQGSVKRITANRLIGRKRSQLSPEKIERILSSSETGEALVSQIQVNRTTISKVRRGLVNAYTPVGLFTGLLVRSSERGAS